MVIISGTGFGTRSAYNTHSNSGLAWAWRDFDEGAVDGFGFSHGLDSSGNDNWDAIAGTYGGCFNRHARSIYWARRAAKGGGNDNVGGLKKGNGNVNGLIYASWWQFLPTNSNSGKFYRHRTDSPEDDFWMSWGGNSSPPYQVYRTSDSDSGPMNPISNWAFGPVPIDIWFRIELLFEGSGASVRQRSWITGQNSNNRLYDDAVTLDILPIYEANMGAGKDPPLSTSNFWGYDDIYIDFTQARVELADASTWAARTKSEIQIPTVWSATSISVNVNQASYANGSTAYLYVIDSAGLVNASGFLVTVGSGVSVPAAPSNLRLI